MTNKGADTPKRTSCSECDDKGLLRIEGTNILVPCLKCNSKQGLHFVEEVSHDPTK